VKHRKKLLVLATIPLVLVVFMNCSSVDSANAVSFVEKAREYVSQRHAVPLESLILVNTAHATYPLLNRRLWCTKLLDQNSRESYEVCFDESGKIANPELLEIEERSTYFERYGRLDKPLKQRLSDMRDEEKIRVAIWLRFAPVCTIGLFDETQHEEVLEDLYAEAQNPIVNYIRDKGYDVVYACKYAPLLFADLPKRAILEIAERREVSTLYTCTTFEPEINTAALTERANWAWSDGTSGQGITIGIVEEDGVAFANPYLVDGRYFDSGSQRIGDHATAVAGIVASTHGTYKGIAFGAPGILSANARSYSDADIIAATEWALAQGARILNHSWGSDTSGQMAAMDRYLDHIVRYHRVTVVKSAGNNNFPFGTGSNFVTSPGLGWNVITVGAIDDHDTEAWTDDTMARYSSWDGPISPHGDREKPEVVAVGSNTGDTAMFSTLTASPWVGQFAAGTSFAAPSVTGEAALLMQYKPSLQSWPETIKAIIMASAWHNIEGNSRLSAFDGAGAIDIGNAYLCAQTRSFSNETVYTSSFPKNYALTLSGNKRVRIAIAWDSDTTGDQPPATDNLRADLDLYLYDPSGRLVASSTSWDNSYEIVEYTVPSTNGGTYTAQIQARSFQGNSEYLGFAYSIYSSSPGGGCPTLFVWNSTDYVKETILNIHAQSDITVEHTIEQRMINVEGAYLLSLRELDNFTSYIDYVGLYGIDSKGLPHNFQLIFAYHNQLGRVTTLLRLDDEKRAIMLPTETINLKFKASESEKIEIVSFIFEINGYNPK